MDKKEIGRICKLHRMAMGIRQIDVANELGCSLENISAFENGRNDSMKIFVWYLKHGLAWDGMKGGEMNASKA